WVVWLHPLAVALLEVPPQARVEARPPRDTALEERETQRRKAVQHAAQEERTRHRLAARREHANMVVDIAGRRGVGCPAHRRRVEGRGHAELRAARPDRVVVEQAVDAERVEPARGAVVYAGCRAQD